MTPSAQTFAPLDARRTYNIDQWGSGYFDVDAEGDVLVRPKGEAGTPAIKLTELTRRIEAVGLRLPVLVRFSNILHSRVEHLCRAFDRAISELEYQGGYTAVYPIKVNQQRRVVEELLATPERGRGRVGLEAGSKPELLGVLALSSESPSLIVCNGYKDREYVRLALMGEKLGHKVFLVVEKSSELSLIIEESRNLGVAPRIGVRARLMSVGKGKWQNSGGEKSKFGLTARQVIEVVERLRAEEMLDSLQLVHFHLGSQIANIRDIQRGLRECARFYQSLREAGAPVEVVDVGGGLGVDYEGTRSRSHCSTNYSMPEYANNVVAAFHQLCETHGLPHPHIISESGRALTAHHAVLITNVIDEERQLAPTLPERSQGDVQLDILWNSYEWLAEPAEPRVLAEYYHDVLQAISDLQDRFVFGDVSLELRAEGEAVYMAACHRLRGRLDPRNRSHREILDELDEKLADKLFVNFSLFQSVPDAWGIDQIFPVLPLTNLDEPPTRRGVIQDITCDSDGRFEMYVDGQGIESTLPLPDWDDDGEKLLGMFLVGAYQEILGDLHNLFGDTDSIDVAVDAEGQWHLGAPVNGDSVAQVLGYVNFDVAKLRERFKRQLLRSELSASDRGTFLDELEAGLEGYTYLEQ
ncbi:biosynthetic arginine decarboxylase [Halotalea alkalilenta]|uniref:Biosynthetic arginine decarboxylase n=1 Tax=Halotalea alkalilenta TaxID=376489 RepID=A0A172YC85_9GAMM|nr:biosynthetic arginine decarboxylase [Halotalea alkalilenta]ANF56860.1 arginine decarboxylase [Halotalea alkalilenta]